MNSSPSTGKLAEALAKAQKVFPPALFDKENPHYKSRYASNASVVDACRVPLAENGLSVVQTCDIPDGAQGVILETTILHSSGEWISGRLFNAANKFLGHLPGGLAIATIGACAGFSAICGSTSATW